MRILILLLAVVGILVVLGMYMASRPRRSPKADTQPEVRGGARPDEFPRPGEGSAHRPDGTPVPGSAQDRHRHGKP